MATRRDRHDHATPFDESRRNARRPGEHRPIAFIVVLTPIVRNALAGAKILANPYGLLLRVAVLAFIAWMWVRIVVDQMPCFLGVPNCD